MKQTYAIAQDADLKAMQARIDALEHAAAYPTKGVLARVLTMAGAFLLVSALGIGALTAAGKQALHIDPAGNVHILGVVTFGDVAAGPTVVIDPAGHLTVPGALTMGTGDSAVVASGGNLNVGGTITVGGAKGLSLDGSGNLTVPGNLRVNGMADRVAFSSADPNGFLSSLDMIRLCADPDGCHVRLTAHDNSDPTLPVALSSTWLRCDASCGRWRTSGYVRGETVVKGLTVDETKTSLVDILHFSTVLQADPCLLVFFGPGSQLAQGNDAGVGAGDFSLLPVDAAQISGISDDHYCSVSVID